ncbi:MAG TPA: sugar-binding domain-containing protein [Tepidisphaeraceae bacterium]|jgi:beta-galactosidase/beta-glucuronidase
MKTRAILLALGVLAMAGARSQAADEWKPGKGPLMTRWAKDVSPENAHPEYPRPQMVRKEWQNLNGLWQFQAAAENEDAPLGKELKEQILVPFPVESALSGLMRHETRMWYRRTFEIPKDWNGRHVLLHLDAVDWEATVYVNGKKLGAHRGGYDAFGYDITKALNAEGKQEIIVGVYDPTDTGDQPRGKQVSKPNGIWYTPTSGIWQTVWIEPVNEQFIEQVQAVADVDAGEVKITVAALGVVRRTPINATVTLNENGKSFSANASGFTGRPLTIKIPDAALWSPESPTLYSLHVELAPNNQASDAVDGYFAMRKIALGKDEGGINRLMLNNKPVFMVGPLDQGFWPDGLYTAPTDDALKFDIETEKKYGFNMARKHVKVEPERWYYWADKLGLLVWQDMPSGPARRNGGANMSQQSKEQFEYELDRMIAGRGNHPSIVMWVVFNEGWGQFDTERLVEHVRQTDPTRLVNNASGWTDMKVGDVMDMHHYSDPSMPKVEEKRAAVLGEFGGLGLPIEGHMWPGKLWQYRGVADREQLTAAYIKMLNDGWKLKDKGLCALVYTQTTDVETESNGLMTYDRAVFKVNPGKAAPANRGEAK